MKKLPSILAIYPREAGGEWNATRQLIKHHKSIHGRNSITELEIKYFYLFKKPGPKFQLIRNWLLNFNLVWKSFSKFQRHEIDIVYSTSLFCLFVANIHPNTKKSKQCFHFHGMKHDSLYEEYQKYRSTITIALYILFYYALTTIYEKLVVSRVDKIICPSNYSINNLQKHFPDVQSYKLTVIQNGIDHKLFKPEEQKQLPKKPTILFSGRLTEDKGVLNFIKVAKQLKKMKFIITYPATKDKEFEKKVMNKANRTKNLQLRRNQTPLELASLYQRSSLTIIPSIGYHEQLPLVFLESIASGTPVLSTLIGELTTLQKKINSKLLLDTGSAKEITQKIKLYIQLTSRKKQQIQQKCLKLSKQFSWNKSAKELNKVFQVL